MQVVRIEEEEECLIPMGSVLPQIPQRVLGIGGTAGMVHPSTGEHTVDGRGVQKASPASCEGAGHRGHHGNGAPNVQVSPSTHPRQTWYDITPCCEIMRHAVGAALRSDCSRSASVC